MANTSLGALYVSVGVDATAAVREVDRLMLKLKHLETQIKGTGAGANFAGLTAQLKAAEAQANRTSAAMAKAGTQASKPAQDANAALLKQQEAQYAALLKQRELDNRAQIESIAAQATARQRAGQVAAAEQKRLAALSMAQLEREIKNTAVASEAQVLAARKTAEAGRKAAEQTAAAHATATRFIAHEYDVQARAAEKAAAKEIIAARLAAQSRTGAIKRASSDFMTGGAAAVSGNPGYALANLAQGMIKLSGASSGAGMAVTAATAGIVALGVAAVAAEAGVVALTVKIADFGLKTAASFEMLSIQLSGLLGSAKAGREEMDWLLNLGKQSIVPTESLVAADRQLAAFGVSVKAQRRDLVQFISDFGTATTATEQQIYFLALAVGQVAARGKADSVDLKQLANAGVKTLDVYKAVGKEIGVPWQKVRDGVKDGIITSDALIAAVGRIGEKYQKTAERARNSTMGLLANIKDIVTVGLGRAFKGLNKELGGFLKGVMDVVNRIDFSHIATAVSQFVGYIKAALGGVSQSGTDAVYFFNHTLPQAINVAGAILGGLIRIMRTWWEVLMMQYNAIEGVVSAAIWGFAKLAGVAADVMDRLNMISDEQGAAQRAHWDSVVRSSEQAMSNVLTDFQSSYNILRDAWSEPLYKSLYYTISPLQAAVNTGQVPKQALDPQTPEIADMLAGVGKKPLGLGTTSNTGSSGSNSGANKALEAAKKIIEKWKELIATAKEGKDALAEAFTVPFASKVLAGGGKIITEAFKNFTSGDVSQIVSQYKTIKKALEDFYSLAEAKGGKVGRAIAKQRKADVAFLKQQTGELIRLAAEAQKIQDRIQEEQDRYDKMVEEIEARRAAMAAQAERQSAAISRQYDGYYTAISATEGTFVEGSISIAEKALEAATTAYENAQAKLDELKAARDDFLNSLKEMALSFVNDLSKVNQEITRFTRLDSVGSFSQVTEEVANTQSFTQGLKDRLTALKNFAANIKALTAAGLDKALVQQIAQAGPEQAGALATALAGASSTEIADINAVQADLAQTISDMQTEASAQWFDAGIAAQEAFTAPLKAAMESAQAQVDALNQQKDLALGILEAWTADQNALFDAETEYQKKLHDMRLVELQIWLMQNQNETERVAATIDERLKGLADTAYSSGIATIDGLIKGLQDDAKLKELKAAARAMAQAIKDSVNSVLEIRSPSRVMMESGYNAGLGLALGLAGTEPLVAAAASGLGQAVTSASAMQTPGASGTGGATLVKVYLSDRELEQLVDNRVEVLDAASLDYVSAGRGY